MFLKRFAVVVLLFAAGAFGSANAQSFSIPCQPGSLNMPYARGSISISYNVSSVRLNLEQVQLVGDIGLIFGLFVGLEGRRYLYFLEHRDRKNL